MPNSSKLQMQIHANCSEILLNPFNKLSMTDPQEQSFQSMTEAHDTEDGRSPLQIVKYLTPESAQRRRQEHSSEYMQSGIADEFTLRDTNSSETQTTEPQREPGPIYSYEQSSNTLAAEICQLTERLDRTSKKAIGQIGDNNGEISTQRTHSIEGIRHSGRRIAA